MIDPMLEPLLSPASDEQAGKFLSQLIVVHAEPVIKGIIRYKLYLASHHAMRQADVDDLCQEAIVKLLTELQQFRKLPDAHPINDVRGLAAAIAYRVSSSWMRRQFRERHALKNRLYYLLTRLDGFALWQNENKKLIAGFAAWRGQKGGGNRQAVGAAVRGWGAACSNPVAHHWQTRSRAGRRFGGNFQSSWEPN